MTTTQQILPIGRGGRDDDTSPRRNPNRGKARAARMTPPPRLSDGVRHPVTVYIRATPRHTPAPLGRLPRVKASRRPWTAERVLLLAERAERAGHHRKAAALLDRALLLDANPSIG